MNTLDTLVDRTAIRGSAFVDALAPAELLDRTPAAFASAAHATTSPTYSFLPTERVLNALGQAGFVPVGAAQTRTSADRRYAARHVIRLRRRYETVQLTDSIPEIVFINGHDGRTAISVGPVPGGLHERPDRLDRCHPGVAVSPPE
jgi:hypothetical protein